MLGHSGSGCRRDQGAGRRNIKGLRTVTPSAAGINQVIAILHLHLDREVTHHLRRGGNLNHGLTLHA